MTRGLLSSTRTAAFIDARLLEVDELVIAGVAEMAIEPNPLCRVEEGLGGQRPAFKVEQLELVPVALHHDVFLFANAFDFTYRRLELEHTEVMQGAKRDDEIEMLVAPRIGILCTVPEQIGANGFRRVAEPVLRDVEPGDVRLGKQLLQLVQEMRLAATHVENTGVRAEPVVVD